MSDEEWQRRSISFGSAAGDYARYRPAPPAEAAEWALGAASGLVIDLAAGSGNLTRRLLGRAEQLVAVDVDPRMLAALGQQHPGVARVAARGEVLPFGAGAAGAVLISSAWHWLDPVRAWPELARVLSPGGILGVMRSGPDRTVPWVDDVLGGRAKRRVAEGASDPRRGVDLPVGAPFAHIEERMFTAWVPYSVADLPGLAASYSQMMILTAENKRSAMAEVAARAAARAELVGATTIELPLRCGVWRATRE